MNSLRIPHKIKRIVSRKLWLLPIWMFTAKANRGLCPICDKETHFVKYDSWLRDNYRCIRCWSIPRQRAIVTVLNDLVHDWSGLSVHESSPGGVSSDYIKEHAKENYVASHFFADLEPGQEKWGFRCENLENMTFDDEMFDLIVTQDVMEHVLEPGLAFKEINRTLKPGGMHVFTVPLYNRDQSKVRARKSHQGIEHIEEPDYHGNPIDESGSLVVTEWGLDIVDFIRESCGLETEVLSFGNRKYGLEGEFLDVLVTRKPNQTKHSKIVN